MIRRLIPLLAFVALSAPPASAHPVAAAPAALQGVASTAFPVGKSLVEAELDGTVLRLWAYKPASYTGEHFVLLFHGASRAAEAYRDNSVNMADRYGFLIVVPEFDLERFPNRLYQFGGVLDEDGAYVDPSEHTYRFVPLLARYIRDREGRADLPWTLAGFSAGGQFVSRLAALMDVDAERLVVMSPGSVIFPTRELEFGLGFAGLPDSLATDARIRRYLALPITVYVGTHDTELAQLPTGEAYAQGVHRYSRALHWFTAAMDLAYERKWDFNWRLVIADGPGHSPPDMFDHPQIGNALFGIVR